MQIEKVLTEKEINEIEKIIERNYGLSNTLKNFIVFMTSEDKIWITAKEVFNFNKEKLRVNSIGLYIGKLKRNNKINLSLEGIHLFANKPNRNVVVVNEEKMKKFMQGSDVVPDEKINCETDNFVLVKYLNDFIGIGIWREDKVENLVPKSRRIYQSPIQI